MFSFVFTTTCYCTYHVSTTSTRTVQGTSTKYVRTAAVRTCIPVPVFGPYFSSFSSNLSNFSLVSVSILIHKRGILPTSHSF